jgi:hypothetical protein
MQTAVEHGQDEAKTIADPLSVVVSCNGSYQRATVVRALPDSCRVKGAIGLEMADDVVVETSAGNLVQGHVLWSLKGETCIKLHRDLQLGLIEPERI